ncbi:hypothetical protein [Streptomyces virginiae]|uniref:hypothetical protein n=1 Tax=Streptomyces virginiae TaxID=1961 RepID=UPI0037025ED0
MPAILGGGPVLEQAQEAGLADPDADARTEAIYLLATAAAMGTDILVGRRSPESAIAVFRHHPDRISTTAARAPAHGGR